MSEWDGRERRSNDDSRDIHDTVIRIDANLSNFMRRFDDHVKEDKESFQKHEDHMKELDGGQNDIKKYIWTSAGAVAVIIFIIKIFWR